MRDFIYRLTVLQLISGTILFYLSSFHTWCFCISLSHFVPFYVLVSLFCSTLLAVCKTRWQSIRKERTKRENGKCMPCFHQCGYFLLSFSSPHSFPPWERIMQYFFPFQFVLFTTVLQREVCFLLKRIENCICGIISLSLINCKGWSGVLFRSRPYFVPVCIGLWPQCRSDGWFCFFKCKKLLEIPVGTQHT